MPKRTKAVKITDKKANKPWLKKVLTTKYNVETREKNKLILIVNEGQTEKLYFESFPVLALTVEAIDLGGQSKNKLIEATEAINNSNNNDYDEIWCVFDMDVKQGAKEFADFDNAIRSGRAKGFNIAYSNDSFELWFYLHYDYTDQKNLRDFYYEKLGEKWDCNYRKEGKAYDFCTSIYDRLKDDPASSQKDAIDRAEKLYKKQIKNPFHKQNPVTKVYELVRVLNKNLRD